MSDDVSPRAAVTWQARRGSDDPPAWHPTGLLADVGHKTAADVFASPTPTLGGSFDAERWSVDAPVDVGEADGWRYRTAPGVAFAAVHIDDRAHGDTPDAIQKAAHAAYRSLFELRDHLQRPHVLRIWHWLSAVTAGAGDDQRYKRFCRGRAEALDEIGSAARPLPPATLVSGDEPGLRMHVLLGDRPSAPIENPRQISAFDYPRDYGIRAPAFARAGRVWLAASPFLLVSGTASIVGHESRHIGDVVAQAHEALNNIEAVMQAGHAWHPDRGLSALQCLKAYLRHPADADAVATVAGERAPGVALALLHAPLCRDTLLVEFEAQMPLI